MSKIDGIKVVTDDYLIKETNAEELRESIFVIHGGAPTNKLFGNVVKNN